MTSSSSDWRRQAACRGLDPDLFFPERGNAATEAKAVCATCPVTEECYEAGRLEFYGVWGGKTRKERQKAELGYVSGKVPFRGCWICGLPCEPRHRYCSNACRGRARANSQARYHQKAKQKDVA